MKILKYYLYATVLLGIILLFSCNIEDEQKAATTSADAVNKVLIAQSSEGSCTAPDWDPEYTYSKGDVVSFNNHEYEAKRRNQGVMPDTSHAYWSDLGACGGPAPPPPRTPLQIYGVWHAGNRGQIR